MYFEIDNLRPQSVKTIETISSNFKSHYKIEVKIN